MSNGFPSLGKKPASANPGNYVKNYARSKKLHSPRHNDGSSPPRVKLLPSTKPIPVELPTPDTSITGFGFIGIVFLICLLLFLALALAWLH